MIIKCLSTGMFDSNSYILSNDGEAVIIDAGVSGNEILKAAEDNALKIVAVILTHSHIDHICSVDELKKATGAKVYVHADEKEWLINPRLNLSAYVGKNEAFDGTEFLLENGSKLSFGGMELEIIHTPGHTPGSICIKTEKNIFTGDTLFNGSVGRTDLPKGNHSDLINSIKSVLMALDDDYIVYPGHGSSTSIGIERKSNPFLKP